MEFYCICSVWILDIFVENCKILNPGPDQRRNRSDFYRNAFSSCRVDRICRNLFIVVFNLMDFLYETKFDLLWKLFEKYSPKRSSNIHAKPENTCSLAFVLFYVFYKLLLTFKEINYLKDKGFKPIYPSLLRVKVYRLALDNLSIHVKNILFFYKN